MKLLVILLMIALGTTPVLSQDSCAERPAATPTTKSAGDPATQAAPQAFEPYQQDGSGPALVFLGDSLTRGDHFRFATEVASQGKRAFSVYAIGGQKAELLATLFSHVTVAPDAVGIIWIGRNSSPAEPSTVIHSIDAVAARFRSGRYLVLSFLSGRYGSEQPGTQRRAEIDDLNTLLRFRYRDRFVDVRPLLTCDDYDDNIHLVEAGYGKVAAAVSQLLADKGW